MGKTTAISGADQCLRYRRTAWSRMLDAAVCVMSDQRKAAGCVAALCAGAAVAPTAWAVPLLCAAAGLAAWRARWKPILPLRDPAAGAEGRSFLLVGHDHIRKLPVWLDDRDCLGHMLVLGDHHRQLLSWLAGSAVAAGGRAILVDIDDFGSTGCLLRVGDVGATTFDMTPKDTETPTEELAEAVASRPLVVVRLPSLDVRPDGIARGRAVVAALRDAFPRMARGSIPTLCILDDALRYADDVEDLFKLAAEHGVCLVFADRSIPRMKEIDAAGAFGVIGRTAVKMFVRSEDRAERVFVLLVGANLVRVRMDGGLPDMWFGTGFAPRAGVPGGPEDDCWGDGLRSAPD